MTNKPSWRDHYDIHPAAAFYHGFSSDEQLKELAEDIDQRKVIFEPIHTASVLGKTFVIDGVSRLDAAEKTGRRIIDEKGNWIGMLDGRVIHHSGKTDEEVWSIVTSLNNKRRHLTKEQILEAADHMLKRTKEGERNNDPVMMKRSFSPTPGRRGGSTKDPHTASLRELAEKTAGEPISDSTLERYLRHDRQRQKLESRKKTGKKPVPFDEAVWTKWSHFLTYWGKAERQEATKLVEQCLSLFEQWPADKHTDVTQSVRRWLSWFNNWPVKQHIEVIKLVREFLKDGRAP
jgi:hypothetical protein